MRGAKRCWIIFAALAGASEAQSHEVRPSIANVVVTGSSVELEIETSIEALVAEIDLSQVADTDEADGADLYDALRLLPPGDLEARFRAYWPSMRSNLRILGPDGAEATPELTSVRAPEVGDAASPRESVLAITAETAAPVRIGWSAAYGDLILRQQQAPEDRRFTGLVSPGALSPPIASADRGFGGAPLWALLAVGAAAVVAMWRVAKRRTAGGAGAP